MTSVVMQNSSHSSSSKNLLRIHPILMNGQNTLIVVQAMGLPMLEMVVMMVVDGTD